MRTLWVRIYILPADNRVTNSFYVGHEMGGLSKRIVSYQIREDDDTPATTFQSLRNLIEWKEDRGMFRRTQVYCELLDVMLRSSNTYGYSKVDQRKYRFGTIPNIGGATGCLCDTAMAETSFPAILSKDIEDEPIEQIIGTELDLIIVPLTQICPSTRKVIPIELRSQQNTLMHNI